ncbi:hypothetical protein [Candidatus Nitrosotalea sp. TS]|uniref:hypothetical protein n=1 Tax=Candidatus Nitrosotalea sp. TS TaxID=2341020 RepID=UPI00140E6709|nr:hypothetical protein [Candidatus Nitrosotalea sp. TS]
MHYPIANIRIPANRLAKETSPTILAVDDVSVKPKTVRPGMKETVYTVTKPV